MAQLPRDPRQLARDILSGKVKLEDLAREKARQMPGGMAPTARVPSPRPVQAPPRPVQPPPVRTVQTAPARPPAFPPQAPRRQAAPPPPPPRQAVRGPQIQRPRQAPPVVSRQVVQKKTDSMAVRTAAADQQQAQAVQAAKTAAVKAAPMNSGRAVVRQMVRNRQSVRTGMLMAEILGPCKALRDGM